tara:strand:- start:18204 stop:18632 length:429 start_codon:yes stop_codon:yes gene_type:complete
MSKLNPAIHADTLSVLLSKSDSITCSVEIDEEYSNVSLRFDRGDSAEICGYPQEWVLWSDQVTEGSGNTYHDAEMDPTIESFEHEIEDFVYVSKETEKEIFRQLRKSLERQFEDPEFKDHISQKEKDLALEKIDSAINRIKS